MPRPKRSKVAPSAPTPVFTMAASNRVLMDVSSPHSSARHTTNSDDSEGLITTIKRNVRSKNGASEEISMSGALAPDDVKGSTRLRPPHRRQRAALSLVAREADHVRAIEALKWRRDKALAKERAPKLVGQEMNLQETRDEVLVPLSMPKAEETAQTEAETEHMPIETRTVERIKSVPFSTRKLQATPIAESSILALAKFKRRPRQPSILQIGRRDDAASESELDDMLDDFHPDDESTPFHVTRLDSTAQAIPSYPTNTHLYTSSSSLDRRRPNPRKRKLTPPSVQVPDSQSSPFRLSSSPPEPANNQASDSHISPEAIPCESDPDLPSNVPKAPPAETIWSDTMAPPESSSPSQSPAKSTTTNNTGSKRKHATRKPDERRASTSVPAKSKMPLLKSISTVTLQNLLPRRRHRPAQRASGAFDIPDSSDLELDTSKFADDKDELSFAAPKGRGRATTKNRKPMKSTTTVKKKASKTVQRVRSQGDGKGTCVVKTYSRRLSDKENLTADGDGVRLDESEASRLSTTPNTSYAQGDTNKTGGALPAKAKVELKTLAQKFKEVDQWKMEFEEVTASSSSPWDAR
ncbi:hypothetical protein MMC18_008818 [Xylographa bjoerkii]|nr:hypothetical protein [Xylographa bjoerkii]